MSCAIECNTPGWTASWFSPPQLINWFLQIIARNMISHKKGGAIVNITSLAGTRYFKDEPLYSSTKAAVDMLTKSMAVELAPHKVSRQEIVILFKMRKVT